MVTIQQLALYPVKSLRGFSVDAAELIPEGFRYDRQWMIVNNKNRFVTQRQMNTMVLIHTHIENQQLILSKPSSTQHSALRIDINAIPQGEVFEALIWKDTCSVVEESAEASEWITHALESPKPLRLVRMQAGAQRPQSTPDLLGADTHTLFADAAPLLVANTQSLAAINEQLSKAGFDAVTMEHFRPNIVVEGIKAFAEHHIHSLEHSDYVFTHCYPCQRCIIPTIDVNTGIRHPKQQPFSLLADINPMPNNAKAPAFGENAIVSRGEGMLVRVGDCLNAIEKTPNTVI